MTTKGGRIRGPLFLLSFWSCYAVLDAILGAVATVVLAARTATGSSDARAGNALLAFVALGWTLMNALVAYGHFRFPLVVGQPGESQRQPFVDEDDDEFLII